jgi:rubrerythrin
MYAVFLFDSEAASQARELLEDDLVSRQSVTLRDAGALGTSHEGLLVVIEGDEAAITRFEDMAGDVARRLPEKEAAEVFSLLKREEEDAAEGVGFLFG